jgi:hypothetical protein
MKALGLIVSVTACLATAGVANAQIYESKDAQGNTVFSDQPTAGAETIKVAPTNSADSVEVKARPAEPARVAEPVRQAAPAAAGGTQREENDDYIYYGGGVNNNEEAQQRREALQERREEGADRPGREPPAQVQPHSNTARPAVGGGGGRR